MDNSNENKNGKESEPKNPRLLGVIYMLLGVTGLCFSSFALVHSLETVPLYGTVTAGSLIGLLSILIIFYGYRVFKKDY